MKLFVGNIPFSMSEEELNETFAEFGSIVSCKLIKDAGTGRSRGFGFIEYGSKEESDAAIEKMNNTEVQGKALVVNEARPQEKRAGGGPRPGGGGFRRDGNRGDSRGGDRDNRRSSFRRDY